MPRFLFRWLSRFVWVRPRADLEKCTGCGICAQSCPVEAIQMVDGVPVTDYQLCINCLCCNESCPEGAMIQEMSWIARRLG
jgi:ferredoxin